MRQGELGIAARCVRSAERVPLRAAGTSGRESKYCWKLSKTGPSALRNTSATGCSLCGPPACCSSEIGCMSILLPIRCTVQHYIRHVQRKQRTQHPQQGASSLAVPAAGMETHGQSSRASRMHSTRYLDKIVYQSIGHERVGLDVGRAARAPLLSREPLLDAGSAEIMPAWRDPDVGQRRVADWALDGLLDRSLALEQRRRCHQGPLPHTSTLPYTPAPAQKYRSRSPWETLASFRA